MDKSLHLLISGRVQGVSFRYATQRKALDLGLVGWVRNLPDGRVEAVFEGDTPALEQVLTWCHQGPGLARVDDVHVEWVSPIGHFDTFEIRG